MPSDLFRSFEAEGLDYVLIGGQAAVLYGAAFFTQDVDIWVRPAASNLGALLRSLARVGAVVDRLTPPVTVAHAQRGHGFHFRFPERGAPPGFLDVLGRPPRVGPYARVLARARRFETPFGVLPVVSTEDLVELKKTDRPSDYEVISRLVRLRLAEAPRVGRRLVRWAVRNVFLAEDLLTVVEIHGHLVPPGTAAADPALARLLRRRERGLAPTAADIDAVAAVLAARALGLQRLGRAYWRPIRDDLKRLRAEGRLLPEGLPVREIAPR